MRKFKQKFWFLIDPIKQIAYGMAIYVLFAFAYNNLTHAANCVNLQAIFAFATSTTSTRTSYTVPVNAGVAINNLNCNYILLTGSEYQILLNYDTTNTTNINTLNTNVSTVNNLATTANNNATTANNNATTANNNATTASQNAQTALNIANQALEAANNAGTGTNPFENTDNILNINQTDAITLMYAILGLFAVAFVGRMYRKSVSIADSKED